MQEFRGRQERSQTEGRDEASAGPCVATRRRGLHVQVQAPPVLSEDEEEEARAWLSGYQL